MPGYVIQGTFLPDGTWVACIPAAVEERWAQGDTSLLQGCEYQNINCSGGGRYRCHRDVLANLMPVPSPPSGSVRRVVQRAEREEAVAEVPAVVRPVARVGAGVMSVVEAAFTPDSGQGGGSLHTGVVDPWAQESTPPCDRGEVDAGPVLYASKGGDVFGARGKVGEVQKTVSGELRKGAAGALVPETLLPEGAVVEEASVMPVGPWVYVGVGVTFLAGLAAGTYYLVKKDD